MQRLELASPTSSLHNTKILRKQQTEHYPAASESQERMIRKNLEEIFQQRHINFLRNSLFQEYGRNYPLDYKPHFNFEEKWENSLGKKSKSQQKHSFLKFENGMEVGLYILITLCNSLAIWLCTLDLIIYGLKVVWVHQLILALALLAQVLDSILKLKKKKICSKNTSFKEGLVVLIRYFWVNILAILLFFLKSTLSWPEQSSIFCIFQASILLLLYFQMSKYYHSIRVMNFSQKYQYHFKVADLIITLLMISHIMALVLFSSTKAGFKDTWITKYGLETEYQLTFYIYSFYFATTTVLTVGYGDITPANSLEVATLTFVQICGIIILAYVINQIGFCLSFLRKKSQILEKDMEIVEKLKKYYKLDDDVVQRVNEFLINSNERGYQITPEQEKGVINKLNQQLRSQVSLLNHLSIVKSSIFLVCRWSKAMQNEVALKLEHTLFAPNNTIYQPPGKQRLYFIKSGVIGVYACNDYMTKLLKTISNSLQKQVSDNCYGYTAALSSRKIRLQAIAKEFTSAYYIDKDKFLKCALEKQPDFEYYHQIKTKFLLAKTAESFQLPLFDSNQHHYNPNKYKVVKRFESEKEKRNKRGFYIRQDYHATLNREISTQFSEMKFAKIQNTANIQCLSEESFRISDSNLIYCNRYKNLIIIPKETLSSEEEAKKESTQKTDLVALEKQKQIEIYKSQTFHHEFESGKEYENYFSKSNRSVILGKMEKEQYMRPEKRRNLYKSKSSCTSLKKYMVKTR